MRDPRLGARVRELREIRGWSQETLARMTGTSREAVSRDERTGAFEVRRILRYAAAFGVVPELLLEVLDEEEEAQPWAGRDARTTATRGERPAVPRAPGEPWLLTGRPRGSA